MQKTLMKEKKEKKHKMARTDKPPDRLIDTAG